MTIQEFCCLLLVWDLLSHRFRIWRNDAAPVWLFRGCAFEGMCSVFSLIMMNISVKNNTREVKDGSHPLVQLKDEEGTVSLCLLCGVKDQLGDLCVCTRVRALLSLNVVICPRSVSFKCVFLHGATPTSCCSLPKWHLLIVQPLPSTSTPTSLLRQLKKCTSAHSVHSK